jgi:cytochrome c553
MAANAPRLSDQHAGYLEDQLRRFADGERQGTVMNGVATGLTETDRKAVAEYLSGLR